MYSRALGPAILLLWFAFLLLANYLTFWDASKFKTIVGADPVYTVHTARVGWPVKFGTQTYSRRAPIPTIAFSAEPSLSVWNMLFCGASLFSVYTLTWRLKSLTIAHLFELTTAIAIALTAANTSRASFGWNFWDSFFVYLFACPIALLAIRLPYQLVKRTLKVMRAHNPIAG